MTNTKEIEMNETDEKFLYAIAVNIRQYVDKRGETAKAFLPYMYMYAKAVVDNIEEGDANVEFREFAKHMESSTLQQMAEFLSNPPNAHE